MSLKNKKRIYCSLSDNLLKFVEEQSYILNMTKSQYIMDIILEQYKKYEKKKIDQIIDSGKKDLQ